MGLTVYDENGEERKGEDGRFDREYYKVDENGELVENSFSDREQLIMATYVAYDYKRDFVISGIASSNGHPITIPIESPLLGEGEYIIIGGNNGGRSKTDDGLGLNQDTEGIFKESDENNGYDAIIVQKVDSGEEILINVGSESHDGIDNAIDWKIDADMGYGYSNPQYVDGGKYFFNLMMKGHNIVVVIGDSLGGGDSIYSGYIYGDMFPGVKFVGVNNSGVPENMMFLGDVFPPNVYSIVSNADPLGVLQLGGRTGELHLRYPKIYEMPYGIFGFGENSERISVEHRGVVSPESQVITPALFELYPYDLLTGDIIAKEGHSIADVDITPEVLEIIANNYLVEIDETTLINNGELDAAKNLIAEYDDNFTLNVETKIGEMFVPIYNKINEFSRKVDQVLGAICVLQLVPAFSVFTGFAVFETISIYSIIDDVRTLLVGFESDVKDIIINPLGEGSSEKVSRMLGKLDTDISDLKNEFNNVFPCNNNIGDEIKRVAENFNAADSSNNKIIGVTASADLYKRTIVNSKDYESLEIIKEKVDTKIDELVAADGPLVKALQNIKDNFLDTWIADAVQVFTTSMDELKARKQALESYSIYSEKLGRWYKTDYYMNLDESRYENGGYYNLTGIRDLDKKSELDEIENKLKEKGNIDDMLTMLKSIDIVTYVVGVLTYYRPLLQNAALDIILCDGLMTKLNTIAMNNYAFSQVAKNLVNYLESGNAKSRAITKIVEKHNEYMRDFHLWHGEICDITVNDLELEGYREGIRGVLIE